jgi:hypothetical protein
MVTFNEYGFLPEGIHKISLAEVVRIFGFNEKRREMIANGLIPFLRELAGQKVSEVYLDGSFVTKEENPHDMDGYVTTNQREEDFLFVVENQERWRMDYRVACYWALTDINEAEEGSAAWWEHFFSCVPGKPSARKGCVVLNVSSGGG